MENEPVTVCYNGDCSICRKEIAAYRRGAEAAGIALRWCDIAADPDALTGYGISADAVARRLHVVEGARVLTGVAAFEALWRQLPRKRWLARLLRRPAIRLPATLLYEGVLAPALFTLHRRRQARRR